MTEIIKKKPKNFAKKDDKECYIRLIHLSESKRKK